MSNHKVDRAETSKPRNLKKPLHADYMRKAMAWLCQFLNPPKHFVKRENTDTKNAPKEAN